MPTFPWPEPQIHGEAWVAETAVLIGDVHLAAGASLWPLAVARGDVCQIRVGEGSNVQDGAVLHGDPGQPVVIGADVTVGHSAILHACTIEDACLIGMHATVLDGAIVRKHGFVAAGAVIAPGKIVGEGELWIGNPARCVRKLDAAQIEALYYSAKHYVKLKDEYLGGS